MLGIYLTTQIQSYVAHNPNVLPHVFTAKHRWDKFIKLTGNHQKDFAYQAVVTHKYIKEIGKDKIVALFEVNKNNIPLLRNAWVEVGIPYK